MQQRSVLSLFLVAACGGDGNGQVATPVESCAAEDLDVAAVCSGNTSITASASEATATPIDIGVTYAVSGPGAGKRGYVVFTSDVSGTFTLYSSDDPMRVCDVEPLCRSTELDCAHLDRAARYDVVAGLPYVIELRPQATTAYLHVAAPADDPDPDPDPQLAFDPPQLYAAGTTPSAITIGDLDADQDLDLVVATPDDAGGQTTIDLLENDGAGAFLLVDQIFTSAPEKAVIADWDLDGRNDIAGIGWDGQGPLPGYYLVNQGDFTFENRPWSSGIDFESHPTAADFDEDGTPELVSAYRDSSGVSDAGGIVILDVPSFTPLHDEAAFGASTGQAVAGDFDGDGHQDVVVTRWRENTLRFHRGDGSGRVAFASEFTLEGETMIEMWAFDLDGDGRSELVSTHGDGSLRVTSNLTDSVVLTPSHGSDDVDAGDLDGDGRVDLAFIGNGGIAIYVARDTGFEQALILEGPDGSAPWSLSIGDLDGDGRNDITATAFGAIAVYLAN